MRIVPAALVMLAALLAPAAAAGHATTPPGGVLLVSAIVGSPVRDGDRQVGHVSALIIETDAARVVAIVVSVERDAQEYADDVLYCDDVAPSRESAYRAMAGTGGRRALDLALDDCLRERALRHVVSLPWGALRLERQARRLVIHVSPARAAHGR